MSSSKKSSTNSTISTEKVPFTAEELCRIIQVCRENSVSELQLGNMKVLFGGPPIQNVIHGPSPAAAIADIQEKIAEVSQLKDQLDDEQDDLDEEMLRDPLSYERKILNGELLDGDGQPDEE